MNDTTPPDNPSDPTAKPEASLAARILKLQSEHRVLDLQIAELYNFPYRDQLELQRLKKRKLRIKDTIKRLQDALIPDLNA